VKPRVYLETSFISYLAGRLSSDLVTLQRQLSSQRWWERNRGEFDLYVPQAVYEECMRGDEQAVQNRLALLKEATLLPVTPEAMEIARELIDPGPFPKNAEVDAIHIAVATVYACDYLLTWNFKHINNARLKRAATRIIEDYGYQPTIICTPDELLGSDGGT